MAVDAHGMPLRAIITGGTKADCKEALSLIDGIEAEALLADRAFDVDYIIEEASARKMNIVIPPKKNRVKERGYDRALYKLRHLIENAFLYLKRWRGIATRYAKNAGSFLAAVQVRCIALWIEII